MRKLLMTLLVSMGFVLCVNAQKTITGKVTDAKSNPIPNVSVMVKGTTAGTSTAPDGTFTINVPAEGKQLVFSSVNFDTEEITIGKNSKLSIVMYPTGYKDLDGVVVTGIVRIKKSQYTGAGSKLVAREIENKPVGSLDQLFQGRVPGVLGLTGSGQPGNPTNIIIRGTNSISGSSDPLYIIDGIPVEAGVFQSLNSNDIASVDILRDAATQALYGSRASGGVIVITTKRGTAGKTKISYSAQAGLKSAPDYSFRPMSTSELLQAQHDYGKIVGDNTNTNIPGWYYSKENPRYTALTPAGQGLADLALDSISKINTNWANEFFRRGTFSNHEVSISGGTGKTTFYSNIGLYNEEGIIIPSDLKRATFRNNLDYVDNKISFSVSSTLGYSRRNFDPAFPGFITNFRSFLIPAIAAPYSKVRNNDGSLLLQGGAGNAQNFASQYLDIKQKDKNYNNQFKGILGVTAGYKITNNLVASITAGADFRETQSSVYNNREAYVRTTAALPNPPPVLTVAGAQTENLTRFLTTNVRPSLTFSKTINKHDFSVTAVGEYIQEDQKGIGFTGYGIDPRTPNTSGVIQPSNSSNQLYPVISPATNYKIQSSIVSGLGLLRYTYNNKYTVTGSYRKDGSSKLPKNTRWTDFYSVGALWDITKEDFIRNNSMVNVLRLKASYGGSGNSNNFPSDYLYQSTYGTGNYSGLPTQIATYPGNPEAKWETTYTLNVGLDFEFLHRRLYGDFNWYDKRTKDLFVSRELTAEGGGFSVDVNAGELQNTGFEWNVNYDIIRKNNVLWTVFATGAYNKNKLISIGGETPYESGTSFLKEGLPLGSHYEVKWGGVDAATGQPLYYDKDGNLTNIYKASDAVTEFGTWEAPWKGGFGSNLTFKGFDFSVLFSWQQGAKKNDNLEYFVENPTGFLSGGYNQSSDLNFWQKPGDVASTPSPLYSVSFSSKFIHDASFIRLRDVVFGYTIPKNIISKTKIISGMRFYVQGTNLFMWTKWRGSDPEAGAENINLGEFPNPRAFTFGLNVNF